MDLHALCEETLTGLGFELVDLEFSARSGLVRVFIDQPAKPGGIDVEDCAFVSHHLSQLFIVENVNYQRLEVSSPGLDRPLKTLADFARFVGQRARITTRRPLGNRRHFEGTLLGVEGENVSLEWINEAGEAVEAVFAADEIDKARLAPEFLAAKPRLNHQPRQHKRRKK
ncbi:MAG: ribosome maturation factor RimP [Zoogloeaceae bacterium]|jgi:ribosome maturation factor RimP|nr:ribosome maturation factor RimP [Zoogloeaceae bacterium]